MTPQEKKELIEGLDQVNARHLIPSSFEAENVFIDNFIT